MRNGGDDGAAANPVRAAYHAHHEAEDERALHREGMGFTIEFVFDGAPCATDDTGRGQAFGGDAQRLGLGAVAGGKFGESFVSTCLAIACGAQQVAYHAETDVQQYQPHEELEVAGIGKPPHPEEGAHEYTGQCARDDHPYERPDHASFADVAGDTARDGDDIVELVRGAHRGGGVAKHGHLEGQEQKRSGDASHGGEERYDEGDTDGKQGIGFDAGGGKVHGHLHDYLRHENIMYRVSESSVQARTCHEVSAPCIMPPTSLPPHGSSE